MIDITGLREDKRPQSSTIVHALLDRLEAAEKERDAAELMSLALRTKITEMERQEPVRHEFQGRDGAWYPFIDQRHYENTVADGTWPIRALYALPGAQPESSVPDGWKLVPIEPTPMMKTAGIGVEVYQDSPPSSDCLTWKEVEAIYTAMLAAAPEAKP